MTAILSQGLPSILHPSPFDQVHDGSSDAWYSPYMSNLPVSVGQWPESRPTQIGGMYETDLRMFQSDAKEYEDSFHGSTTGSWMSPDLGYHPEPSWGSDVDMATPSTGGFSNDHLDAYHPVRSTISSNSQLLSLPASRDLRPHSVHSPQSSVASPVQQYAKPSDFDQAPQRPSITRSVTAPDQLSLRKKQASPTIKRAGSADEGEDDDYAPSEDPKRRGRKRQRIPHTAVERRYRENLNAHLDRLRQNVPALSARRLPGSTAPKPGDAGLAEGVKPSKCEILNGAIEHIGALGKEMVALESENKTLRARIDELERWYGNGVQQ